jgi:crotonobetainyl-CoA:carnitine CoA-transferase CaiB-like acyl-CoA transferase
VSSSYPLEGLRVLDLSQYVAGPYCTQVLADLGATVLKVERPAVGDVYRRQGPVFAEGASASFLTLNRGKRSIELDLTASGDRERLGELLAEADVFVENMRPGALAKYGLDYESVAARHPRLVYCSISAHGQVGPLAGAGGYDVTIQALSGLMSATGHPDQPPAKIPVAALDFGSALYAVVGVLAALSQRGQTGRGQWVQTSLLECALAWLSMHVVTYLLGGEEPAPLGSRSPFFAPYEAYRTRDGYLVVVGTGGRDAWQTLCRTLGLERLLDDPRFATNSERVRNAEELRIELEAALAARSNDEWVEVLEAAGIACAPVQRLSKVLDTEQTRVLRMVDTLDHPRAGAIPTVRLPITLSGARTTAAEPPPVLGADNGRGFDEEPVAQLADPK